MKKRDLISGMDHSHPLKHLTFRSRQRYNMMQCSTALQKDILGLFGLSLFLLKLKTEIENTVVK